MAAAEILDLDLGNSRVKYRCGDVSGSFAYDDALPELPALRRVRVSSVQRDERAERLLARLPGGIEPEFARSQPTACGVRCGYRNPEQLGVDRWLAVVAAFARSGGALVADLGTAATLDYVDTQGNHLGGFIVPGWSLMQTALLRETAKVRFESEATALQDAPGRDTATAVQRGAAIALARLLDAEADRAVSLCGADAPLIITGGDAGLVSPLLRCPHQLVPELVLDGLALALD